MIYVSLVFIGLALGSFVNALVWRLHKQAAIHERPVNKQKKRELEKLSITKGRSMCMHCNHELAPKDLVPVASWVWLRGKCRYCKKPIDDTPVAELLVPLILLVSYIFWPFVTETWSAVDIAVFAIWTLIVTCFVALSIYDAKWYLLPDRIVVPLTVLAVAFAVLLTIKAGSVIPLVLALSGGATISGLFFGLSYISKGEWIGWGDVKLGVSLGILAGGPLMAFLVVFIASLLGTLVMAPGLVSGNKGFKAQLPFGPFLIAATVVTLLWGGHVFSWYSSLLLQ